MIARVEILLICHEVAGHSRSYGQYAWWQWLPKTVRIYERVGRVVGTSASVFTDEHYSYV